MFTESALLRRREPAAWRRPPRTAGCGRAPHLLASSEKGHKGLMPFVNEQLTA